MPDPYGRYANLMARHPHLKSTFVNTPNIRDRNGAIKFPSDHSTKLGDQKPVFIMVKLRLWVSPLPLAFSSSSCTLTQYPNPPAGKSLPKVKKKEQHLDSSCDKVKKMVVGSTNWSFTKCHYSPATFLHTMFYPAITQSPTSMKTSKLLLAAIVTLTILPKKKNRHYLTWNLLITTKDKKNPHGHRASWHWNDHWWCCHVITFCSLICTIISCSSHDYCLITVFVSDVFVFQESTKIQLCPFVPSCQYDDIYVLLFLWSKKIVDYIQIHCGHPSQGDEWWMWDLKRGWNADEESGTRRKALLTICYKCLGMVWMG